MLCDLLPVFGFLRNGDRVPRCAVTGRQSDGCLCDGDMMYLPATVL